LADEEIAELVESQTAFIQPSLGLLGANQITANAKLLRANLQVRLVGLKAARIALRILQHALPPCLELSPQMSRANYIIDCNRLLAGPKNHLTANG
jgi:hypothetical protein